MNNGDASLFRKDGQRPHKKSPGGCPGLEKRTSIEW